MVEDIVSKLLVQLTSADLPQSREALLTDEQLCTHLQISTSHLYQLKKKHKSTFPVYNVGRAVRYKLSEVESFFKSIES
jgi:predicted DNA-binding transcriptional regulator AlpA